MTRLSLAVDSIPVRMLVQQFRTVHRPLPIVGFQAGFLAHTVNVFIITFKKHTRNTTFFQQFEPLLPVCRRTAFRKACPYPVLHFARSYFLYMETSFIINDITHSLCRIRYSDAICVPGSLHCDFRTGRKVFQLLFRKKETVFGAQIVMLLSVIFLLGIEHGPQQLIHGLVVRIDKLRLVRSHPRIGKVKIPPTVGHVHVNFAGSTPHPVFFRSVRLQPLHAREIDTPRISRLQGIIEIHGQCLMRNGHFHTPIFVLILWLIQCSLAMNSHLHPRTVPLHHEVTTGAIRFVQHQVEYHATGIGLDFKVIMSVTIRVNKHLEVIIIVNNGIAPGQTRLYIFFFKNGTNIQIIVIPKHFGRCLIFGSGESLSADVDKRSGSFRLLPRAFVQLTVHLQFAIRTIANIRAGSCQETFIFLIQALGSGRETRQQQQELIKVFHSFHYCSKASD